SSESIFWDFNLPNATTWFYFSFLLAVALFFKFSRWLSMRNWDVVTLFLLVPGLLLLQQSRQPPAQRDREHQIRKTAPLIANPPGPPSPPPAALATTGAFSAPDSRLSPERLRWLGYLTLLLGSAYFFLRCLLDLLLVQRPALTPNLNFGGLAWLAGAFF